MGRKKGKHAKGLIIGAVITVLVVAVVLWGYSFVTGVMDEYSGKKAGGEKIFFTVTEEDDIDSIAAKLESSGIIKYKWAFSLYASTKNLARGYTIGQAGFPAGTSYANIIDGLLKPEIVYVPRETFILRIPEGYEVNDIIELFLAKGISDRETFERTADSFDFGYSYIPAAGTSNRLEGFLYPDTYEFYVDSTAEEALRKLVDTFDKKVVKSSEVKALTDASGMSFYDLVIFASIVEKEAGRINDMPLIASVFSNRMEIGMKLQSCATFNYTVPKADRNAALTSAQISSSSPYNTYYHKGLPPTPICNPSVNAIKAAAAPAESDYLFFCAKGNGETAFAKTAAEHEANIKMYKDNW